MSKSSRISKRVNKVIDDDDNDNMVVTYHLVKFSDNTFDIVKEDALKHYDPVTKTCRVWDRGVKHAGKVKHSGSLAEVEEWAKAYSELETIDSNADNYEPPKLPVQSQLEYEQTSPPPQTSGRRSPFRIARPCQRKCSNLSQADTSIRSLSPPRTPRSPIESSSEGASDLDLSFNSDEANAIRSQVHSSSHNARPSVVNAFVSSALNSPPRNGRTLARNARTPAGKARTSASIGDALSSPVHSPARNGRTPARNGRTPARNARTPAGKARTPAHNTNELRSPLNSPARNARTPARDGRTPARNSRTPANIGIALRSPLNSPARNGRTPAGNARTPAGNARTPARNVNFIHSPLHSPTRNGRTPPRDRFENLIRSPTLEDRLAELENRIRQMPNRVQRTSMMYVGVNGEIDLLSLPGTPTVYGRNVARQVFTSEELLNGVISETTRHTERIKLDRTKVQIIKEAIQSRFQVEDKKFLKSWPIIRDSINGLGRFKKREARLGDACSQTRNRVHFEDDDDDDDGIF